MSCSWFEANLEISDANLCNSYLKKRKLSKEIIKKFRLGHSYNSKESLYEFLKNKNYLDKEILKSNLVKIDRNNKIRDYFYKG